MQFAQILPVKQLKKQEGLTRFLALLTLKKHFHAIIKRMRTKKALIRLKTFVKGYFFDKCRELFYSDVIRFDEKKEDQFQK